MFRLMLDAVHCKMRLFLSLISVPASLSGSLHGSPDCACAMRERSVFLGLGLGLGLFPRSLCPTSSFRFPTPRRALICGKFVEELLNGTTLPPQINLHRRK